MASHEDLVRRLFADARNRAILTVLDGVDGPLTATELAERVVARDVGVFESSRHREEFERVLVSLHHHRLPKLADAGLVEYDHDEGVVSLAEYPSAEPEWVEPEGIGELLARFRPGAADEGNAIGMLEGREDVYEYARRLADEAENELFLVFVSDDLLDEGCLPAARDAIDRGVDFRVGSRNPEVREFFRTNLPRATIWEPQLDWANDPSRYPRLDRLVFADRERIVFGFLDDPDAEGSATETAIVGEGERNPLVVLVRELLGPRLDHLDHQSADAANALSNGT